METTSDSIPLDPVQQAAANQFSKQSHRYGKGHVLEDVSDVRHALDEIRRQDPRAACLSPHSDTLDVACGAGHTGMHLASLGHSVVFADISDAMLERCRELAETRGVTIQTRQTSAERLPFADKAFDLVTCRVAAHHFSDVTSFLNETHRVLKAGGWLLLIDGSVEDNQSVAEEWLHQVEKLRDPSHARFRSIGAWRELCATSRLAVEYAHLFPMKQPDLNWYFETAATAPENRAEVMRLIQSAPSEAKALFRLNQEDGKVVWWWQRLTLLARK